MSVAACLWFPLACSWSAPVAAIGNLGSYRSLDLTDCVTYVDDYDATRNADGTIDRNTPPFASHAGFVLGYLSAFNAWVVNDIVDISDGMPFEQIFALLADHCRSRPDQALVQALEALISTLWTSRDPGRVGKPPWPAGSRQGD